MLKRPISDELEPEKETKRNKSKFYFDYFIEFIFRLVVDKSQIMKNIIFVLSGFQNPLRSELRNKAIEMGANYSDDWDETCTHLMYLILYLES